MIRDDEFDETTGDRFDDVHADAPLYAAGALEQEDRQGFEEHLEGCAACREEVDSFGEALAGLAASAPMEPPRSVRDGLLARIHEEASPAVVSGAAGERATDEEQAGAEPGGSGRSGPAPVASLAAARQRRRVHWPLLAVAAVLVPVVGFGGWVLGAQRQEQDRRAGLMAAGDLTVDQIEVEGRSATLFVSASQEEAMLVASDLPDPGEGREYQLWLMRDQIPAPDAHFSGGEVGVWLDGAVGDAEAVAMTVEPAGGSPAPTTDPPAVVQL